MHHGGHVPSAAVMQSFDHVQQRLRRGDALAGPT